MSKNRPSLERLETYDKKGDLTRPDYVIYAWKKGPDGRIDYAGNDVAP